MKKTISLLLAWILTLSLAVPAFAVGGFSDVPSSHWAYSDIMACAEAGIVTGYADGSFHPGDNVTTVQFLVMMTRTFHADKLSQVVTPAGQPWYYANLKVAEDTTLSSGLTIEDTPMDRYSMAQALYNELAYVHTLNIAAGEQGILDSADTLAAKTALKDWDNMALKQKTWVKYCYGLGILSGMSDGTFSGEANMTRAQACAVIVRMMNLVGGSTPAAPAQPTTPVQPQQPETPAETAPSNPNASSITVEYALEVIAGFKQQYPAGTVWDDKGTNGNKYADGVNSTDVKAVFNQFKNAADGRSVGCSPTLGCGGFVAMVSDAIFGQSGYPAREVTDPSKIRPGDIIVSCNSKGQLRHVYIATSTASYIDERWIFDRGDGNLNSQVDWSTGANGGYLWSNTNGCNRAFTRYPD